MTRQAVVQTPDEAFQLGLTELCDHGYTAPEDCPSCRLTDAEIGRLTALLCGVAAQRRVDTAAA
ncbi:hypothetical protein ABTX35_19360 [Streptomyces sp. NPDC096080]|uniref:hypothetical protein n=1 Tax=Streptomyces sp. NPDC096080 TaxID=3156693 RepID=UPI0033252909